MAQAEHTTTYDVDASTLMQAVMDYEKYPEFVDGMKKVRVDRRGKDVIAHYELSMLGKDMSYSLKLNEEPESGRLRWTLYQSDFFKVNNGDWQIESLGEGKCKARYFSEVDFTFPVPGFVLKPLVKSAVPKMMEGFYQRAKLMPKPEQKLEPTPTPEPVKPEPVVEEKVDVKTEEPKMQQQSYERNDQYKNDQYKNSDLNDSGVLSWAKKLMTVGVGTFFLTEEALRNLVTEFKFPKEIMGSVMDGAKSVRKEFMQNVVNEMMNKISDKMNPSDVLAEFLKKNEVTFEIKLKVKEKTDTGA